MILDSLQPQMPSSFKLGRPASHWSRRSGFTIVEMLVVILIISIAFGCTIAFLGSSTNLTNGANLITGLFQQAQAAAVSRSTYVWVGIFEENPAIPQVSGIGQLVMSTVASTDGTNLLSQIGTPGPLPSDSLIQISPLTKIPNFHVQATLGTGNIGNLPIATYQIDPTVDNGASFVYPLQGTQRYKFIQIVQFNPQGDASVIYGEPLQILQLGLIPAEGNTALTSSKNLLAIQICGIGGKATIYRP